MPHESCFKQCSHRDLKPENLLLTEVDADAPAGLGNETSHRHCNQTCSYDRDGRRMQDQPKHLHLRLIDFGSALDHHSTHNLYGSQGPSSAEQTVEYAPPEAVLGRYAVRSSSATAHRITPCSAAHLCIVKWSHQCPVGSLCTQLTACVPVKGPGMLSRLMQMGIHKL